MIPLYIRRMASDRRANAAMVLALTLLPIAAVSGFALDGARQVSLNKHVQYATDAAALAGARTFKDGISETDAESAATSSFVMNIASSHSDAVCEIDEVDASSADLTVSVTANCSVPTVFGIEISGLDEVKASADSTAAAIHQVADVSMMFDLSSSMNATELGHLKAAGKRAAEIIIGKHPGVRGRVAIVPFATGVNAGDFGNQATGRASGADPENDNRVRPSGFLERVCVTERVGANAFTDLSPDTGGLIGSVLTARDARDLIAAIGGFATSSDMTCPDSPVHPLDGNLSNVHDAIDGMQRSTIFTRGGGRTSGHMGIAWSWYSISPRWTGVWTDPIYGGTSGSAPHPYGDPFIPKVAILMTDGIFQHGFHPDFNSLDADVEIERVVDAAQNLCANMRDAGVEIYAIGLQTSAEAEATLANCTGNAARVFTTSVSSELEAIYEGIAQDFLGTGLVK